MSDKPFSVDIVGPGILLSSYDNHILRTLADMKNQFFDQQTYLALLEREDTLLYEVYEIKRPAVSGELLSGLSIVHPGKVGNEYFMTKGHFHKVRDTAEIYYCLQGQGCMVMETPEGECDVVDLYPGRILYVPPCWAHRSVNTASTQDLVTFFVYPGHAGHDYGTIECHGFRKLVIQVDGKTQTVDNPRWIAPGERQ